LRGWEWRVDGYDFIAHWVQDPCNAELATRTVYTLDRTPEETCAEIIGICARDRQHFEKREL
jgi:hypothetical protein